MAQSILPVHRLLVPLALAVVFTSCHTFPTDPNETRWPSPPPVAPLANVSGKVFETGTLIPVAGATVWINEVSSVTDAYGNYNIAGIRGPQVLLQAVKPGFDTTRVGLQLNTSNITFNLQMKRNDAIYGLSETP